MVVARKLLAMALQACPRQTVSRPESLPTLATRNARVAAKTVLNV